MAGVARALSAHSRVVLLVPDFKKEYFEEEYGGTNIVVEGVDTTLTKRDLLFRFLILAITHTKGLSIKKRAKYFTDHNILSFLSSFLPSALLRGAWPVVAFLRLLDPLILNSKRFGALCEKYKPDLVFSTDVQNEMDVRLIEENKRRGIHTVGMVRSWDNVSSKGLLRAIPETMVVHNPNLKRELISQNHIREERIETVGIPHYDRYFKPEPSSRDEFFSFFKLDSQKPLILVAPIGNRYIRDNTLDRLALETLSEIDANILVRLPPTDSVNFEGFKSRGAHVIFQQTGDRPWKSGTHEGVSKLNEVTRHDEQTLIDSLSHASVVVTGQSTIAIDAAAFGKPIVIIYFDSEPRAYLDSVRRYYDYEYYAPLLQSGGLRLAKDMRELKHLTEEYLAHGELDRAGRVKLIEGQAWKTDAQSTSRLVELLLARLA